MTEPAHSSGSQLQRRLGLPAATLTGLGVIIGSGIYVVIGVAAGQAGNAVWSSFLLAALGASLTASSYARLAKVRARNAPEYQYVNMAFGRRPAFFAGWLILIAQVISASAVALGFAGYLNALLGVPEAAGAAGLLAFCMLILYMGIIESALATIIFTVIEVLGLVLIIVIAVPDLGNVDYLETSRGLTGIFTAASLVFFAYIGFEGMANLAEEMANPERDLPKAIILSIGISTGVYMLVAISAVSVLGWEALSQSNAPLALVAEHAFGDSTGLVMSIISLVATANTALVLLLAGSRILHAMACARALPVAFCQVSRKRRTPLRAILAVGVVSLAMAMFRSVQQVAEFTNFVTLLAFVGVNASAVRIFRGRDQGAVKHALLNRLVPILGILVSLWLMFNAGWRAAVFGAAALLAGALVDWSTRKWASGELA